MFKYVLSDELKADNPELIDEIFNLLDLEELTSIYEFRARTSDKDLRAWNRYCSLVNNRPDFSSEQIVSLCTAPDSPEDHKEISAVIETILNHINSIKAYSVINTGTPIYRCVNYIDLGYMPKGFSYLPASFIGTAPAKFAGSGRFNEAHDMMFYGASNPRIAAIEVGERNGFPYTIGTFYVNKCIRVLNLCNIWDWMCPSIFESESEELRESWFFLRQFIKLIIESSDGL